MPKRKLEEGKLVAALRKAEQKEKKAKLAVTKAEDKLEEAEYDTKDCRYAIFRDYAASLGHLEAVEQCLRDLSSLINNYKGDTQWHLPDGEEQTLKLDPLTASCVSCFHQTQSAIRFLPKPLACIVVEYSRPCISSTATNGMLWKNITRGKIEAEPSLWLLYLQSPGCNSHRPPEQRRYLIHFFATQDYFIRPSVCALPPIVLCGSCALIRLALLQREAPETSRFRLQCSPIKPHADADDVDAFEDAIEAWQLATRLVPNDLDVFD